MNARRWVLLLALATSLGVAPRPAVALPIGTGIDPPDEDTTTTTDTTTTDTTSTESTTTTTATETTTTVTTTTEPPTTTTTTDTTTTVTTTTATTTTAPATTTSFPTTTTATTSTTTSGAPTTSLASTTTTTTTLGGTGSTSTSTSVAGSTTTSTLPVGPLCTGGALIERGRLQLRTVSKQATGGVLTVTGRVPLLQVEGKIDPSRSGVQIEVGAAGRASGTPVLAGYTTARRAAVPPGARGTGCGRSDGWKAGVYRNKSGRLDPPACDADAHGLQQVQVKDRRAKTGGVTFRVVVTRVPVPDPATPLAVTIVFGGPDAGQAGLCGQRTFDPSTCTRRPSGLRCH